MRYFVVNSSAERFNLRCTLAVPKNTGNTYDTGMQQAQVEAERGGGSKIYGVTNYWQQLVLSRLPGHHLELLSKSFENLISPELFNQT